MVSWSRYERLRRNSAVTRLVRSMALLTISWAKVDSLDVLSDVSTPTPTSAASDAPPSKFTTPMVPPPDPLADALMSELNRVAISRSIWVVSSWLVVDWVSFSASATSWVDRSVISSV